MAWINMGWLSGLVTKISGQPPTEWSIYDNLPDPGLEISGKEIKPDQCYVELYVESFRLEKARNFTTTFHPVIYSFVELARLGNDRAQLASVTKPKELANLDPKNFDKVITYSKQMMPTMPWRGTPFGLQLGLFSVKSGNLLTPLIDYVTKVSERAGIAVAATLAPFTPLVTEGLDMIAGQTADTAIELAIDTDIPLAESRLCALVARRNGEIPDSELSIDPGDRKLLHKGKPLNAGYCVFSIRRNDVNPRWGEIVALREAYAEFTRAVIDGKRKTAEEAKAAFSRRVIVSPDLISADKKQLMEKVEADFKLAFHGGPQAASPAQRRQFFEKRELADLQLYGS